MVFLEKCKKCGYDVAIEWACLGCTKKAWSKKTKQVIKQVQKG